MPRQSLPAAVKLISGYILPEQRDVPSKQDDLSGSGEEEEEEEERQPEFLDMKEMNSASSGGQMFNFSVPASKEVDFQAGNKKYRIEGRFPLRDPWWLISCTVRQGQRKHYVKGYPSYRLRTDLRSEGRSIVSLFLKACGTETEFVTMFMEWLPKNRHVELVNVMDALLDFAESKPEHKAIAEELKSRVRNSVAGTHVRIASMYPGLMKYLPTLLPGQFMAIINKGIPEHPLETSEGENSTQPAQQQQNNTDVLAKLEEIVKTDVWKLGFNYIMFKELHLIRCEAKVEAFLLCNLFNTIPELQRNALLLYTEVKRYCSATGSTYIQQNKLEKKMGYEHTWVAVRFLEDQGVLKRENRKVALRNLFGYENGIAECLRALVEGKPWRIQLDVRKVLHRAHQERLRTKASEKQNTNSGMNVSDQALGCQEVDPDDIQPGSSNGDYSGMSACLSDSDSDSWDPDQAAVDLDPDQVRAAEMMCDNPVTVISGKGGCGKTTVVSLVFKAAMQQQTCDREEVLKACEVFQNDSQGSSDELMTDPFTQERDGMKDDDEKDDDKKDNEKKLMEVLLTAPTGRAASLLTKRTSFKAYTMHQVLWSFMCAKKDSSGEPKDWKFSKVQVLVVDEGSLVSVQILHSLLSMLTKHAQLQKFILLGDVRQLPSIDPGNTLYDLFEGLRKVHWAIEMQTNHRAESELIVENAGLISEMGKTKQYSPLEFDATMDMTKPSTIPPDKSFIFVQICGENYNLDLQNAIIFLLENCPGLREDRTSQFVAFRRKDCELINELCCKNYSGHVTKTHKNKIDFRIGDKVCCTKNGYVSDKDKEAKQKRDMLNTARSSRDISESQKKELSKKERLCNGEIFFIKEDVTKMDMGQRRRKTRELTIDDENGRVVKACFRELQKECKLRHAWARTIHTFQGSEAETIVYVLGDSRGQNWQHVYTAVTRGQKRVYVVGREADIERSIKKVIIPRETRLCSLVKKVVSQPWPEGEETLTQSGISQSPAGTQDFGPSQISGFEPTQSTPVVLHTPSFSQASCSARPSCVRHLYKNSEAPDTSLQDDMIFSQTYSWSPMYVSDEPSTSATEFMSKLSDCVGDAALPDAISSSSDEISRSSKRLGIEDDCTTPRKLAKQTTSEESPLGSTRMKLLSISSPGPKSHGRQLFQESSSQRERP